MQNRLQGYISFFLNKSGKGQSAIEYLTTYGWMVLVIAIVGGAIFGTVQQRTNIEQSSGFSGEDVQVTNFGLNSNQNLALELRAAANDEVIIRNISLRGPNVNQVQNVTFNDTMTGTTMIGHATIPRGQSRGYVVPNLTSSQSQNTFNLEITYDTGRLDNLQAEGGLTSNIAIEE